MTSGTPTPPHDGTESATPVSYRHAVDGEVPAVIGGRAERERQALSGEGGARRLIYSWLFDPTLPGNYHKAFDRLIVWTIILNLFALLIELVPQIHEPNRVWFDRFEIASVILFTVEYLLRLYTAPEDPQFRAARSARIAFIRNPFAVVDLLAVLPFYLQAVLPIDLRALRVLRLLRLLKIFRLLIPAWQEFAELNRGRTFRQRVHALVFPSEYGGRLHGYFDAFIAAWVLISVFSVILESVHSISYLLHIELIVIDVIAVAIFTMEYCARLYCCVEDERYRGAVSGRLRQAKSASMVIDLLAILPFFLEALIHHLVDLRFLRIFRLLRLLKLTRYTGATRTLAKVIVREWPVMAAAAFIMLLLVVLTASLGYLFEHEAQPDKFENIPQSIYWAVITLASVGYGDISPVTPAGRAITIVLALIGIGIFAIPAALLSSAFSDQLHKERDALKQELFDMLADGQLSEEEAEVINREAKRLHLSAEDVEVLIEQARREREAADDLAKLPLHKIAERPEHAVEHFKSLVSEIRQLGLLTDTQRFEALARSGDRLTVSEWQLWRQLTTPPPGSPIADNEHPTKA
ncbi:MAG: ion transporter [Betaproteobacteria bacterium]|nr:ion transporter [Betaproteobacteria bacterium]